jgi:hypothetical protein
MPKLRYGHAPGHVRDCFCSAVDAYADWWKWNKWKRMESEPTVEFEVNYVPRPITISKACDTRRGVPFEGEVAPRQEIDGDVTSMRRRRPMVPNKVYIFYRPNKVRLSLPLLPELLPRSSELK